MRKQLLKKYLIGLTTVIAILAIGTFPAFGLGSSSMALVATATVAATPFATQVKLLAISGSVYAILQVVKQVFPLAGLGAVLLNVALSILGVAVVIRPEDLFSLSTLTAVAIAAITAAGAHGTIKSFSNPSSPGSAGSSSAGIGSVGSGVALLLCVLLVGGTTGCSPLEVQAYRAIVGAKAFTQNLSASHAECGTRDATGKWVSAHNTTDVCVALDKSISAKDALIDLAEIYCSGPDFSTGGPCNPPTDKTLKTQLATKITAAINAYAQTETDVQNLLH